MLPNPFRPGAGHRPPYLAGRDSELDEFRNLLTQETILENLLLTGLRGIGKTVLLDELKPIAREAGWLWIGTDLSESASVNEKRLAIRMLTDLAIVTSSVVIEHEVRQDFGFIPKIETQSTPLTYSLLLDIYEQTPGLNYDKLKRVLEISWACLSKQMECKGVIFAYDESQTLSDKATKEEYPLSLLLDVFQSIQKQGIPFMLALTGLPMLQTKLVEARTFAERMFHVIFLKQLDRNASEKAIRVPLGASDSDVLFSEDSVDLIVNVSGGYPYFIQFMCKEAFDCFLTDNRSIPIRDITRKLDIDFFAGRWSRATDRQRELLTIVAQLPNADGEFTVQEIKDKSSEISDRPFSASHINQMLSALTKSGLVYKNRHGKYSLAVPMLADFIRRQTQERPSVQLPLFDDD
ncbi:MAG: AAA family ATPase [Pirellulales bacterium]|nr:AAA family ATPase [Pirellulales bacterium]